jgi:hypothetical protein
MEDHPTAPYVAFEIIVTLDHLGSYIVGCTDDSMHPLLRIAEFLGETEVNQLDCLLLSSCEQEIL